MKKTLALAGEKEPTSWPTQKQKKSKYFNLMLTLGQGGETVGATVGVGDIDKTEVEDPKGLLACRHIPLSSFCMFCFSFLTESILHFFYTTSACFFITNKHEKMFHCLSHLYSYKYVSIYIWA